MEWQPIETAPLDGTDIIACGPSEGGGYFACVVMWIDYQPCGGEFGFFEVGGQEFGMYQVMGGLTHWTPLPPPPEVKQ